MRHAEPARILPDYPFVGGQEMREAIGLALGTASVCWDPMDCTGVFDSATAGQLVDELSGIAARFAQHTILEIEAKES